jgi:hypothetical protein
MKSHFHVAEAFARAQFPDTCREVNLEYESLEKFPEQRKLLRKCAQECREAQLVKRDGSKLDLDSSSEYMWKGTTWLPHRGENHWEGDYVEAKYHIIRICWRANVSRREYMHYDRWDCLKSEALESYTSDEEAEDENELMDGGFVI